MQARNKNGQTAITNNQDILSSQRKITRRPIESDTNLEQPAKKQRKQTSSITKNDDTSECLHSTTNTRLQTITQQERLIAQLNQTLQQQSAEIASLNFYIASLNNNHSKHINSLHCQYKKAMEYQNAEIAQLRSLNELPMLMINEDGLQEVPLPSPSNDKWLAIHNRHSRELNTRNAKITQLEKENDELKNRIEMLKSLDKPQANGIATTIPMGFFTQNSPIPNELFGSIEAASPAYSEIWEDGPAF